MSSDVADDDERDGGGAEDEDAETPHPIGFVTMMRM